MRLGLQGALDAGDAELLDGPLVERLLREVRGMGVWLGW